MLAFRIAQDQLDQKLGKTSGREAWRRPSGFALGQCARAVFDVEVVIKPLDSGYRFIAGLVSKDI